MRQLGRDLDHLKILPACFVVVGDTVAEARAKRALLDSLVVIKTILDHLARRAEAATPLFRPFARAPPQPALPGLLGPG